MLPADAIAEPLYSSLGGDPDFAELVASFVERLADRRRTLVYLLTTSNWPEFERAAHQLKGAAGSYGFDALTSAAARLEQALKSHEDRVVIEHELELLHDCCNRCRAGVRASIAQ